MIRSLLWLVLLAAPLALPAAADSGAPGNRALGRSSIAETITQVQPKIVKIYGAGGFRGMEGYQSGMLISPEGHILTVYSYVLDTDYLKATLDDGRKFDAKLLGADPKLEVAVLKIDAADLPCFALDEAVEVESGTRVLALSNLFGVATGNEPASVQHGIVSVKTSLAARRGVFETPYSGSTYVLDAMTNNPGAAGGAVVTRRGKLVGMLGKELRNSLNNTWLNYAVPIAELRTSVDEIRAGRFDPERRDASTARPQRSLQLSMLGIVLLPDVLQRTPPYVDQVYPGSPAAAAGIRPDDLILLVGERLIQSCKALRDELEHIDYEDPITLTLLRDQELLERTLQAKIEEEP
ncbi:MAG: serine protease [Pirellulales bacterium]|nr:serine protease [Pirellulales bacterium]